MVAGNAVGRQPGSAAPPRPRTSRSASPSCGSIRRSPTSPRCTTRAAAATLREDRLRRVAPDIMRLTPVTGAPASRARAARAGAAGRRGARCGGAVAQLGARVHSTIVASLTDMLDVVPTGQRVFFGTDDYVAGAALMGTDPRWLERIEERQLAKADVVIAISPQLQRKWAARRPDVHLVPNGCMAEQLASADTAPVAAGRRAAVGRSRASSATCPSASTWPCSTRSPRPASRCCWSGRARPPSRSPSSTRCSRAPTSSGSAPSRSRAARPTSRAIDVGLTPYAQSAFNEASFPLKTLEYLAAGRPAVVSDLPAHRWLDAPHVIDRRDARRVRRARRSTLLERPPLRSAACRAAAHSAPPTRGRRVPTRSPRLIGLDAAAA